MSWLIEFHPAETPAYISGPGCGYDFSICFNPWKAIQFKTKQEAKEEIIRLELDEGWKAIEHEFCPENGQRSSITN